MKTNNNRPLDTISVSEAETLTGLFRCRVQRSPDQPAFHQFDQKEEKWITYDWQSIARLVERYHYQLQRENLQRGDRVAILLNNSIQWVVFEQAALAAGLIVVPLYTWDSPENIAYILGDSKSRLLVCQESEQWKRLQPHASLFPDLDHCLIYSEEKPSDSSTIKCNKVSSWLSKKTVKPTPGTIKPDEPATIIYTSGTTGPPKGVILSHHNILWNVEATLSVVVCYPDDLFLSFLPLSHAFERTVGYYAPMMGGASVAYVRSIQDLSEDLQTMRPTVIISVPRIYEKIYSKIHQQMETKPALIRKMMESTVSIGWKLFEEKQGRTSTVTPIERLLWPLLRKLVADKVLNRLGGRIRISVSGGAPLHESVSRFFLGLGLPLLQGYGLTEAAPVVSTNLLSDNVPTSVGPPLPDTHLKIGEKNELLVKSPGIMKGYWNLEQKTEEVIDADGWLHTGDVVEVHDERIYVRGRLKEILVTSTGEKIPPADLELTITTDHLFDHAMAVGEAKPYIGALLVMNKQRWTTLCSGAGLDPEEPATLESTRMNKIVLEKVNQLTHSFPAYAKVRIVKLLLDDWNIENGLLTPTLKLKRDVIEKLYEKEIAELYEGHELHH